MQDPHPERVFERMSGPFEVIVATLLLCVYVMIFIAQSYYTLGGIVGWLDWLSRRKGWG